MSFTFFAKEQIANALKKLIDEDLEKVAFEEPFSKIYIYKEAAIEDAKKEKAMKLEIEGNIFYIF